MPWWPVHVKLGASKEWGRLRNILAPDFGEKTVKESEISTSIKAENMMWILIGVRNKPKNFIRLKNRL